MFVYGVGLCLCMLCVRVSVGVWTHQLQCIPARAFVVGAVPLDRVRSNSLRYGVAMIIRLFKIIYLFCRI